MNSCILFLIAFHGGDADNSSSKLSHSPQQPKPGEVVTVSAKLPADARQVTLQIQPVAPGAYIRKTDPAFEKTWVNSSMTFANGQWTASVPAEYQKHRQLVRYRVAYVDGMNKPQRFPADEACPNKAWWCDRGTFADWSGSIQPKSKKLDFPGTFFNTLTAMTLVAQFDDVAKSQWDDKFYKQKMLGTIVYRGEVFDHIQFANRGQASTYSSGKNKWSLKFHKNQKITIVDHDGKAFTDTSDSLNLNPGGSTPHLPIHRGITGLDEVLSMKAYRLAGVPGPASTWVQWRVVADANESQAKDRPAGDLWGTYVLMSDMKPGLLADTPLADGLVVSTQSGIKNTPKGMADGEKLWETFSRTMQSNPDEAWWRKNLDIPTFASFHALNRLLGNVDLRPDGNHGYYRKPDGQWQPIPWDNDMMFVPRSHQPGFIHANASLAHQKIRWEFRNRAREILDLFADDAKMDGGQIGQLTHDLGRAIRPKGFSVDWSQLDAALWNHHPRMHQRGSYFVNPNQGHHFGGPWTRKLDTNDFAGFQKYIIDFCTDSRPSHQYAPNDGNTKGYGWGYLAFEAKDEQIPAKLKLQKSNTDVSAIDPPTNATFEWRVAKVGGPNEYEIRPLKTWVTTDARTAMPDLAKAGTYRVRARAKDANGKAGHWSEAVEVRRP